MIDFTLNTLYACECICECLHILKRIGCSSLWRWFLHTSCCLCSSVSKYNQNNISILLDTIFYLWQACVFTSFLTLLSYAANFFRVNQWQLLLYIQNIICIYRLKIRCVVIKLCTSNLFAHKNVFLNSYHANYTITIKLWELICLVLIIVHTKN